MHDSSHSDCDVELDPSVIVVPDILAVCGPAHLVYKGKHYDRRGTRGRRPRLS